MPAAAFLTHAGRGFALKWSRKDTALMDLLWLSVVAVLVFLTVVLIALCERREDRS
jgi:hypothetical protein